MGNATVWITYFTAATYLVAVIVSLYFRRLYPVNFGMLMWLIFATLYWCGVAVLRLFFGYVGPSIVVTLIGAIVYWQAPILIIGLLYLRNRYGKPVR